MNRRSFLSLLGAGTAGFVLPSQPTPVAHPTLKFHQDFFQFVQPMPRRVEVIGTKIGYTINVRKPQRFKVEP